MHRIIAENPAKSVTRHMNKNSTQNTIGIVGLWHLGSVYSACLAELGHRVIAYDSNKPTITSFKKLILPVEENGLKDLIKKQISLEKLFFTSNIKDLADCSVVWLTADTPLKKDSSPDLSETKDILEKTVSHLKDGVVLVVSSQIPVGTSKKLKELVLRLRPQLAFSYVYQPENLQLGAALDSFKKAGRIVVGVDDEFGREVMQNIFSPLRVPLLFMSTTSAEMAKHAINSFLATSLSFIYDIADLCEAYRADVLEVSRALKSDSRIGEKAYLDASIGFSGGTLERDLAVLLNKAKIKNIKLPVINGTFIKNQKRWESLASFLKAEIKDLKKSSISILGATYKPNTSTLRHSLALKIGGVLKDQTREVRYHDSWADRKEIKKTGLKNKFYKDINDAVQNCRAIVLMTAHPDYLNLDFKELSSLMKEPKIFFDAKNFLWSQEKKISESGFLYKGVGRRLL